MGGTGGVRTFADVAQLSFDGNADRVRNGDDLGDHAKVLLIGEHGTVDHDGREAGADRGDGIAQHGNAVMAAVVKVDRNGNRGLIRQAGQVRTDEDQIGMRGIAHIDDDGRVQFFGSFDRSTGFALTADVGGGNRIVTLVRAIQDLFHGYEHGRVSPYKNFCCNFTTWLYYSTECPTLASTKRRES